ncbi:Endonuclease/exonuclease/phosphatase superfamily [Sesbania bispinosa]|nr:Endonuclease/exonuclease/phosphatase superfamily [Sesbania bispinosa]
MDLQNQYRSEIKFLECDRVKKVLGVVNDCAPRVNLDGRADSLHGDWLNVTRKKRGNSEEWQIMWARRARKKRPRMGQQSTLDVRKLLDNAAKARVHMVDRVTTLVVMGHDGAWTSGLKSSTPKPTKDSRMRWSDCKIITWNVHGALSQDGKSYIRELVSSHKTDIFSILDTHCAFKRVENFWRRLRFKPVCIVEAAGHSGGIWIMVQFSCSFSVDLINSFSQVVTIKLSSSRRSWACSVVYGSHVPINRESLWKHLIHLCQNISIPWVLLGYFNEVLYASEVSGGSFSWTRAQKFWRVLDECDLLDIGNIGSKFS